MLELAVVSPRTSEAPGALELAIVGRWLATCLRATSLGQRNRCGVRFPVGAAAVAGWECGAMDGTWREIHC